MGVSRHFQCLDRTSILWANSSMPFTNHSFSNVIMFALLTNLSQQEPLSQDVTFPSVFATILQLLSLENDGSIQINKTRHSVLPVKWIIGLAA